MIVLRYPTDRVSQSEGRNSSELGPDSGAGPIGPLSDGVEEPARVDGLDIYFATQLLRNSHISPVTRESSALTASPPFEIEHPELQVDTSAVLNKGNKALCDLKDTVEPEGSHDHRPHASSTERSAPC